MGYTKYKSNLALRAICSLAVLCLITIASPAYALMPPIASESKKEGVGKNWDKVEAMLEKGSKNLIPQFRKEYGHLDWEVQEILIADLYRDNPILKKTNEKAEKFQDYARLATEPPPVMVVIENGQYRLLDGFHRTVAAKINGRQTITAFIADKDLAMVKTEIEGLRRNVEPDVNRIDEILNTIITNQDFSEQYFRQIVYESNKVGEYLKALILRLSKSDNRTLVILAYTLSDSLNNTLNHLGPFAELVLLGHDPAENAAELEKGMSEFRRRLSEFTRFKRLEIVISGKKEYFDIEKCISSLKPGQILETPQAPDSQLKMYFGHVSETADSSL